MESQNKTPTDNAPTSAPVQFTTEEMANLERLRARYDEGRDQFSARELAALEFLRWLYRSGRLVS